MEELFSVVRVIMFGFIIQKIADIKKEIKQNVEIICQRKTNYNSNKGN